MKGNILLVEDDEDLRNVLSQYLSIFDFSVSKVRNGQEALVLLKKETFDICVLDVMMPKMDGFTLAEKVIDINPETPFIFLTARNQKEDKIRGLKLGADDYIVKPFEADELVLRLNNILKRNKKTVLISPQEKVVFNINSYALDISRLELKKEGRIQSLTKREAELIYFLYQHKNTVIKREDILSKVWGSNDFFSGRSMDVFVSRIRKYFKDDPSISIESIRGVGLEFRLS